MQKLINWTIGILSFLVSIGAIYFGFTLINDPTGEMYHLNIQFANNSPFESFFIPGAIIFAVFGIGNLFAAIFSFLRFPLTGFIVVILGLGIMIWTVIHVLIFGMISFIEPIYFIIGLAQFILGLKQYKLNLKLHD